MCASPANWTAAKNRSASRKISLNQIPCSNAWKKSLVDFPFPPHLFTKGNICFLLAEATDSWAEMNAAVGGFLKAFQRHASEHFQRTISFGISNLSHQLRDVPHICKEAVDALHSGHLSGSTEFIQTYHMKDVSEPFAHDSG